MGSSRPKMLNFVKASRNLCKPRMLCRIPIGKDFKSLALREYKPKMNRSDRLIGNTYTKELEWKLNTIRTTKKS